MTTTDTRRERVIHRLRDIANDLSGMPVESLKEDVSFLELGFDSLFLTQLSAAYQKAFGIRITFRQLFDDLSTLAALSSYIDGKLPAEALVDAPAAGKIAPAPAPAAAAMPAPSNLPATQFSPLPQPAGRQPAAAQPVPPSFAPRPAAAPAVALPRHVEAVRADGLEAVLLQQLDLMAEQLRLLQGLPVDTATASYETAPEDVSSVPGLSPPPAEAEPVDRTAGQIPPAIPAAGPAPAGGSPETPETKLPSGFGPGNARSSGLHPLPAQQQRHLDVLIENYTRKTAGSKQRTQQYRRALADPRTAAGFHRRWKEMVYPIWVERSLGSKLWDVDGNEYIDLLNGFGPHFLGHAPAYVTRAIEEQLGRGFEIGPQTPMVGEVAEMICRLTGMDRASFTCSGSEAVQAAMRLSRTVTGRDKVVVFSKDYHGNFDQVLARDANRAGQLRTLPSAPGIPLQSVDDTYVMEYGTGESLEMIQKHAGEIAAVLVEPVQSRRPEFQPREFLHELRRITRDAGIILVFDEVVTGFRAAPGGAQAYFGVEADLATYGKVIGGGMPIGVVAGRANVMDTFDGGFWQYGDDSFPEAGVTFFAGTFVRHPLAIAAAHAALKYLIQEGPALQQRVADKATRLAAQVNALFRKYEVDIELPHFTSQMYLRVKEQAELANLLCFHLRYRGVHILEGFPSYMTDAHSEADVEHLVRAFTESVESMVEDGIFGNRSRLTRGGSPEPKRVPAPAARAVEPEPQPRVPAAGLAEFPPADVQREMWIAAQIRPEASAANNGSNVVELIGELNVAALERAIAEVVSRHEALRCTFSQDGAKLIVKPSVPVSVPFHDLSTLSSPDATSRVSQILEADGRQIFDLAHGPLVSFQLIRLSPKNHLLVFTAQMIVCDGWGFKVVLEEISSLYSAFVDGREPALEPVRQMREYQAWQAGERGSAWAKECEDFWLSQFGALPPPFELPSSRPRPPTRSFEAARASLRLSPEFYQNLKRVSRELRNTPFALLLTACETWLHRLSGLDDFVVGVPFAGQGALGLNTLVGQCVHTLPFRVQVDPGASFADQLTKTRKLVLDAQESWNSNLGAIVQKLNLPSDPSRTPLVPVMFNLDPPLSGVRFTGCVSRVTSGPRFYFYYDLGFNLVDEGDTLLVECDYNTNLFDGEVVQNWLNGLQALLEGVVSNPQTPVSRLPMLSDAERRRLAAESGATRRDLPRGETVHGLVSAQAARTPEAIAVECDDQRLTYAQLDQRANQVARYLRAQGVGPGTVVGVCVNRSLDMVAAVLGVLQAGGAFAAIDPEWPKDRMAFILADTQPPVLLTHGNLLPRLPQEARARALCLDQDWARTGAGEERLDPACAGPEDLAYVCYTSGSTGRPKGAEISHAAVVNFLLSMAGSPGMGPHDAMLALSTLTFDISILEIFLPLTAGGRIAIVTPQVIVDPAELDKTIARHAVTVMQATPSTWRTLFHAGWKGNRGLKALCGGEFLSPGLASELLASCAEVWNLYGPTETTVWSAAAKLENGQPVTIGRPIANTQLHIVDENLQLVPAGVPGELLIGGLGLARRYRNLPELTAGKFIPDPFAAGPDARLFRTGDIARRRPDGRIQILGRKDNQVKLRGHRIELGEIESTLLLHPEVRDAVVALRADAPGGPRLVAYLACAGGSQPGARRLLPDLRQLLRGKLPAYMAPAAFVVLDSIPRTPAGKVDRSSLPAPVDDGSDLCEEEYTAPRNEAETRLARLWCEALNLERASTTANFFDLGGQSLVAVMLFAKIEKEFGKKLPLATLFTFPTVAGLAAALTAGDLQTSWPSLVPIQSRGSRPPFFLVHGAGGNVLLYRSLGEHFAPDYPLYGLQSRGLDGENQPLRTIEEMAVYYLREVRSVQPKGPYYLGGYCLGGTIAYEMAQVLRRQGEEVPLVAMLDTYNYSRALKVSFYSFLFQKARFHLANLVRLRPAELMKYLKEKARLAFSGELANLNTSMPGSSRADGVARATFGVEAKIQAINDYAAEHYDPLPYPGQLALFRPRFNYKFYPDPKMGWGDLALGGLDIVEVAVNPHSMLLEPYVQTLAAQLKERIDGAPSLPPVSQEFEPGKTGLDLCLHAPDAAAVALPDKERAVHAFSLVGRRLPSK